MDALSFQISGWALPSPLPQNHEVSPVELALLADDLVANGVLRRCNRLLAVPPRAPITPERDLVSSATPTCAPVSPRPWIGVMTALASADWSVRYASLPRIVSRITSSSTPDDAEPHRENLHRAATLTQQFRYLRPWYPRDYLCLFDSLALLLFLLRRGIRARWIFGVKEDPFAAHCWLQIGPVVLNEHLDRAKLYTPIMMV